MSDDNTVERLAALFEQTGEAHHEAFRDRGGEDPEWPIWYAEHLQDRLEPFLAAPLTRSRLVFCLIGADDEHREALKELREVRGRTTVPVLRITSPNSEERWMPESADIVRYLQASYGQAAA